MFSKAIAFGVTRHHCAVAGGSGSGVSVLWEPAGSSLKLSRSTRVAVPCLSMILPHPERGHSKSTLFVRADELGDCSVTSSRPLPYDDNRRAVREVRFDECCRASHSPGGILGACVGGAGVDTKTRRIWYQGEGPCTTSLLPSHSKPAFSYRPRKCSWQIRRMRSYVDPCSRARSRRATYSFKMDSAIPLRLCSGETHTP